jgi:hypothetical protein
VGRTSAWNGHLRGEWQVHRLGGSWPNLEPPAVAIHPTTKIAVSDLDTLDRLLDQVPVHRDTSVNKQRAIGILAPELYAMRAKGYSWGDIAAWLVDHGLTITRVALQGYLRRVRSVDANADSGAARPRPSRARERLASRSPSAAAAVTEPAATPHATPEAPPRTRAIIERRTEPGVRRSEFRRAS